MERQNVVVLAQDIDLRVAIKNKINSSDLVIAGYSEWNDAGKLKIEGLFPDIVICAAHAPVPIEVFDFIQNLLCDIHSCVVVLVTDTVDIELVNTAAEIGVKKVIPLETDGVDFEEALRKVYTLELQRHFETNSAEKVRSKVIGFFGGKGGTGKTTVAVNTAVALAREQKRVILLDFDLQFGDIALAMDIDTKNTVVELIQDRAGVTIENINNFAVVHSSGVSVLCAPKSAEYAEYVRPEHIEKIIDVLRPYFEYIVIDFPPSFTDVTISGLENTDEIFLVYNMEILSLKNAKVTINILEQLHQKDKVRLIINKNVKGLIKAGDFEKMFNMPIYAFVTEDSKAATSSINKGQPLIISEGRSVVAKELSDIGKRVIEEHTGVKTLSEIAGNGKKKKKQKNDKSSGGKAKPARENKKEKKAKQDNRTKKL